MIQDYIFVAAFASFPQALLILLIGFNLSNIRNIDKSKLFAVAAIQAIAAMLVRMLNVYFGVHTIVQIISLYILVIIFFRIKYYKAIIPVLIGVLLEGVIESVIVPMINIVLGIEFINIYYDTKNLVLYYAPVFIASLILLIIIRRNRLFLCDIND